MQEMTKIDTTCLPEHVAIIMDGNGRWAQSRNQSRSKGHIEGVKRVEEIVDYANEIGIKVMTLFTFSTENWSRPESEVDLLMKILTTVLERKITKLINTGIRFRTIGRTERIPDSLLNIIKQVTLKTKDNTGLTMNLAFDYGSRLEIVDALKEITREVLQNKIGIEEINEALISDHLYTRGLMDPDLLIRTSGELRISNFLLWQLSYSELYFTEKLWPDFDVEEFQKALAEYRRRERRFGGIKEANA